MSPCRTFLNLPSGQILRLLQQSQIGYSSQFHWKTLQASFYSCYSIESNDFLPGRVGCLEEPSKPLIHSLESLQLLLSNITHPSQFAQSLTQGLLEAEIIQVTLRGNTFKIGFYTLII